MVLTKTYHCVFCDKTFTRRSWYDKHECTKKKRFAEANNLVTIKAQQLFAHWQRRVNVKPSKKMKPMAEFLNSSFYNTFKKLAEFTQKQYVVSAFKYLDWIIDRKIKERDWFAPKNVDDFREFIRAQETPEDQIEVSMRNIRAWCTLNGNVPVSTFFTAISTLDALMMVRRNMLMPWMLFGYDQSVEKLVGRFSHDQLLALDEFINLEHWLNKVEEYPDQKARAQSAAEKSFAASS